jgi:hypothetical protein
LFQKSISACGRAPRASNKTCSFTTKTPRTEKGRVGNKRPQTKPFYFALGFREKFQIPASPDISSADTLPYPSKKPERLRTTRSLSFLGSDAPLNVQKNNIYDKLTRCPDPFFYSPQQMGGVMPFGRFPRPSEFLNECQALPSPDPS